MLMRLSWMNVSLTSYSRAISLLQPAGFEIYRAHEFIAASHHAGHGLVTLAFPCLHGVGLVPGFIQLAILFRQAQAVLLAHVEISSRDHSPNGWAGHDLLGFEVHLGQA